MWQKAVAHSTAFLVGLILGFFVVIAPLFAGGPWNEYFISLVIVLVLFFLAGTCLGAAVPKAWTSLTLSIPTVVLVVLLMVLERPDSSKYIILFIVYPIIVLISSVIGDRVGSFVRARWGRK
jgi:hypothetical protein